MTESKLNRPLQLPLLLFHLLQSVTGWCAARSRLTAGWKAMIGNCGTGATVGNPGQTVGEHQGTEPGMFSQ